MLTYSTEIYFLLGQDSDLMGRPKIKATPIFPIPHYLNGAFLMI